LPQQRTLPEEESFFSIFPENVQFSAFYCDARRYLLRVWESAGTGASVLLELPFQMRSAKEVDFNGKELGKPVFTKGKAVRFEIKPWEIVTLELTKSADL
jgi:alpha-mannosidase